MKTTTKTKIKGFGVPKKLAHFQTFSCECLWHDKNTDEETLVELWTIRICADRFDATKRKAIALGLFYCFLETQESIDRGINRVFIWNNKTRAYEPLGIVSDTPMQGSETVDFDCNPETGYKRLLGLCEIDIIKMEGQ